MIRLIAFIVSTIWSVNVSAQQISVTYEPEVAAMVEQLITYNDSDERMGWQIQFYSTTDRRNMEQTIRRLKQTYNNIRVSWSYNNPFYQVRAGNFAYRSHARPLLFALKKEYPGAFLVQEKISVADLRESL